MYDTKSKGVEIDPFEKEKLIDLLLEVDQMRIIRTSLSDCVDWLIANGVTVKIKKEKPPTDLSGKCGGCAYAEVVHDVFGGSYCYVKCTNPEHLAKYCRRKASPIRQRTVKACKLYKSRTEPTTKGID